jgi:hypothetical protein
MSRLFNSLRSWFGKEQQIYNEAELQVLKLNHKYFRNKRVSDMVANIIVLLLILLSVALVVEYVSDPSFRAFVIQKIEENLSGLIFSLFVIAGIKWTSTNGKDD